MVYELSDMSWLDAEERFKKTQLAIVPTGAVEQHGLHLGIGTDWVLAWEIARRVGEKTDALVLPIMPYGVSGHHSDFPGVMTLKAETFKEVVYEILACLNRYGVRRVVFINGHGGNLGALSEAAKKAREELGMLCSICMWWDVLANNPVLGQPAETHAGYAETSLMLATRSQAVKMEYAILSPTKQVNKDIQLVSSGMARFRDGMVRIVLKTADVSATGSMTEAHPNDVPGTRDYSSITKDLGENLMKQVVEFTSNFVKAFETFELPKINVSREQALKEIRK